MNKIALSIQIALAKLKVRRARLIVTILSSSLAFTLVYVAIAGSMSVLDSFERLSGQVYDGSAYIQLAKPDFGNSLPSDDPKAIVTVKKQYRADKEKYKELAKTSGLENAESPFIDPILKQDDAEFLNWESPYVQEIQKKYLKSKSQSAPAMTGITGIVPLLTAKPTDGIAVFMRDGQVEASSGETPLIKLDDLTVAPQEAIQPYMKYSKAESNGSDKIPIILDAKTYKEIFGKSEIESKVGSEINVCWKNNAAYNIAEEIRFSDNGKAKISGVTYQKLNENGCSTPEIIKDERSPEQREYDDKKARIDEQFDVNNQPTAQTIKFSLAGVAPSVGEQEKFSELTNALAAALGNTTITRPVIPAHEAEKLRQTGAYDISEYGYNRGMGMLSTALLARAGSGAVADNYIRKHSCNLENCSNSKPFLIEEVTTSFHSISSTRNMIIEIGWGLMVIVLAFALIIMGTTFGRIVDDGRREIAIYRAVGIPGKAITGIFVLYGAIVAMLTALFTLFLSYLWLVYLNSTNSESLSQVAFERFGEPAKNATVSLLEAPIWYVFALVGVIVLCGILSIMLALASMKKRHVVDDLRLTD